MEGNYKSKPEIWEFIYMWKVSNTHLNNHWFKEEITRQVRKHFEVKENTKHNKQNLWDAPKAMLRGKFVSANAFIKKEDLKPITQLSMLQF